MSGGAMVAGLGPPARRARKTGATTTTPLFDSNEKNAWSCVVHLQAVSRELARDSGAVSTKVVHPSLGFNI